MNLELNDTLLFLRVVELGSFTAAARALGVPKATLSRRVQELERQLGARLLERTTRRLALTEAGQVYYDHTVRIARDLVEAESAVGQLTGAPRGWLRITLPFGLGNALGPLMPRFAARYPDLHLEFILSNEVVDLVANDIDLALRVGRLPDSSLLARRIARFTSHVYASPSYLARHGEPLAPADVEHHRVLAGAQHRRGSRFHWSLIGADGSHELTVNPVLVANDPTMLRAAAVGGMGLLLTGDLLTRAHVADGRLRQVLAGWSGPPAELNAVFARGRASSPKVRAFLQFVVETWELAESLAAGGELEELGSEAQPTAPSAT